MSSILTKFASVKVCPLIRGFVAKSQAIQANKENSEQGITAAPAGVDGAVGVSQLNWYVAVVNPRHEKVVADKLRKINVVSYVAAQKEMHRWANGRSRMVDRVVISSMVFVKCTEERRREIVKLPYIHRFMVNRAASGALNKPVAVIPETQMRNLMFMLGQSDVPVDFVPTLFKVKDNVRVTRGPLLGLEGEITRNSDGTHTLSVALSLLGGAVISIDPCDVERLPKK